MGARLVTCGHQATARGVGGDAAPPCAKVHFSENVPIPMDMMHNNFKARTIITSEQRCGAMLPPPLISYVATPS